MQHIVCHNIPYHTNHRIVFFGIAQHTKSYRRASNTRLCLLLVIIAFYLIGALPIPRIYDISSTFTRPEHWTLCIIQLPIIPTPLNINSPLLNFDFFFFKLVYQPIDDPLLPLASTLNYLDSTLVFAAVIFHCLLLPYSTPYFLSNMDLMRHENDRTTLL